VIWLLLAVVVVVPWVAVAAVGLAILSMSKLADARYDAMCAPTPSTRPCPLCHTDDPALVDPDGVALCPVCRCSYEVVAL